jgi:hypothetical protein
VDRERHKYYLWFYGVIVALGIREALTTVAPPLLLEPFSSFHRVPEAVRLLAFLVMMPRFYFGCVFYFDETYFGETAQSLGADSLRRPYKVDLLTGFVHFLFMFFWSLTINTGNLYAYDILLLMVLLYGWFWWLICRSPKRDMVFWWTLVNTLTVVIAGAIYMLIRFPLSRVHLTAESSALVVVLFVSVLDLSGVTGGRLIFEDAIRKKLESVRRERPPS